MLLFVAALLAPAPPVITSTIVAASLFKNGYAVVTREIDVPVGGRAFVVGVPGGSLGTVWLTTTAGIKLASVSGTEMRTASTSPATTVLELLQNNLGKDVSLGVSDSTSFTGKLVSANADVILLEAGADVVALQPSHVRSVQIVGGRPKVSRETTRRGLAVRVAGDRAGRLYLVALERGLTWSPAYSLDITNPTKLHVTAKAVLLDDGDNLGDADVRLVTGFPNVYFLPIADPLLSTVSVEEYVQSLGQAAAAADAAKRDMTMNSAGMAVAQMAAPAMGGGIDFGAAMQHQADGVSEGDLFFYKLPHVTLSKGERQYRVLADASVDYKEVYTWDSVDTIGNNRMYDYQPNQPVPPDDVWHSLRFKNTVGLPLTTGPATTFKSGELLGQDMIRYTTEGSEALVKVTKALDVSAESADEETDRKRAALNVPGAGTFDLVSLRTTLKATNRKKETIHLKVTRPFTGALVDAGDAKVTRNIKGLRSINPTGVLVWERDVEPGKTVTLTFSVKVYVRSGG